jgi:retinol dehydrogenase-12
LKRSSEEASQKEVERYGQCKAMNDMQAHEFAMQHWEKGVVALSLHPRALSTSLQKNLPGWFNAIFGLLRKELRFGALTELFAGLGELKEGEAKMIEEGGRNGGYVLPWWWWGEGSKDVFKGLRERL